MTPAERRAAVRDLDAYLAEWGEGEKRVPYTGGFDAVAGVIRCETIDADGVRRVVTSFLPADRVEAGGESLQGGA